MSGDSQTIAAANHIFGTCTARGRNSSRRYVVKRGNRMLFSVWMCSMTSSVSLRAPA